jgi:hypothetical protein
MASVIHRAAISGYDRQAARFRDRKSGGARHTCGSVLTRVPGCVLMALQKLNDRGFSTARIPDRQKWGAVIIGVFSGAMPRKYAK